MTTHEIIKPVYDRTRAGLERPHDEYRGLYTDVIRALLTNHLGTVPNNHLGVLLFILGRTLRFNKAGQHIYLKQFMSGVHNRHQERIAAGLEISENTLRTYIKGLSDAKMIRIHRQEKMGEGVPSVYEIDCKTILGFEIRDGRSFMPLREIQTKRARLADEMRRKTGDKDWEGVVPEIGTEVTGSYRQKKSSLSTARSATAEGRLTAREKAEQILTASKQQRAARVASGTAKPAHLLSKDEMQALVDTQMQTIYPDLPRCVVTAKDHGLLRKRLKDSAPSDFAAFLAFVVSQWATMSLRHGIALNNRRKRGVTPGTRETPMGRHFSFRELALRYPYFLTVYTNNSGPARSVVEERESAETLAAKAEAERLRRENESLRQLARRAAPRRGHTQAAPTPPPRRMARPVATASLTLDLPVTAEEDALLRGLDDLIQGDTHHAQR